MAWVARAGNAWRTIFVAGCTDTQNRLQSGVRPASPRQGRLGSAGLCHRAGRRQAEPDSADALITAAPACASEASLPALHNAD